MNTTPTVRQILEHPLFPSRENRYVRWYPNDLASGGAPGQITDPAPEGIYIHVPFCDALCGFCPYNKRRSDAGLIDAFCTAVRHEIAAWRRLCRPVPIRYIYFGGGTPSALSTAQIESIVSAIASRWSFGAACEISLEAHPTHIDGDRCVEWQSIGITRVSTGVQSFSGKALDALGSTHTEDDARRAMNALARSDFRYAADLLYAYRGQTQEDWELELRTAIDEFGCPHLSCYPLIPYGDQENADAETEIALAVQTLRTGCDSGLEQYASCASGGFDIARRGHRGVYELEHWRAPQSQFIGCGPGAFGFVGNATTVNTLDVRAYCREVGSVGFAASSIRKLSTREQMRRYFVLGVKCYEIDLADFEARFSAPASRIFADEFRLLQQLGLAEITSGTLSLTPVGRLMVDQVSEAFYTEADRRTPHPEEKQLRTHEAASRGERAAVTIRASDA